MSIVNLISNQTAGVSSNQTKAVEKSGESTRSTGSNGLSVDDFYALLATQIKYQDADNPMDTSEMMGQMVQTQMIDAITQMSNINTTTYASSMVGQTVTVAEVDEYGNYTGQDITGVVSGTILGQNPTIRVEGKDYLLSQIVAVGTVASDIETKSETQVETEVKTEVETKVEI